MTHSPRSSTIRDRCEKFLVFTNTMQGHHVGLNTSKIFDSFTQKISKLYLGGYTQEDLEVPLDFLLSGTKDGLQPLDFPTSYVAVTFAFWCENGTTCGPDMVNDIFTKISSEGDDNEAWGDCIFWGASHGGPDSYLIKCSMYPIAPVPLNFAIGRFFQEFLAMPGVYNVTPTQDLFRLNNSSFSPNVLYMNLSQTFKGDVKLNFFELSKGSSPWLSLLSMFPSLDTDWSLMNKTRTCNGTSMCKVFHSRGTDRYKLNSLDMENQTQCIDIQQGYPDLEGHLTLDDVESNDGKSNDVWTQFGVPAWNWTDLICWPYQCEYAPPYLILHQIDPMRQRSSLNNFLEFQLLLDDWAQNSGVCTKTYPDIIPYNNGEETMFMEANCSKQPNTNRYCWLTGRYRNLNDTPDEGWHEVNESSPRGKIFVCYKVADQNLVVWFILTFGILFGWLGTIDLVFNWIKRLFQFYGRQKETSTGKEPREEHVVGEGDAHDQEGAAEEDSNSSKEVDDELSPLAIGFTTRNRQSGRSLRALSDSGMRHAGRRSPLGTGIDEKRM